TPALACPRPGSLSKLPAFFNGCIGDIFRADVFGARADQAVIGELFQDVGGPAGDATACKHGRIQVYRDAHHVVDGGRVEVNVGVQSLMLLDIVLDDT